MTSVRVTVVQAGSVLFDTAATHRKAEHHVRAAASRGARLIVLPEAFLGGYPEGLDSGIAVGHCARPDVSTLTVDGTPRATVRATAGAARAPVDRPAPDRAEELLSASGEHTRPSHDHPVRGRP